MGDTTCRVGQDVERVRITDEPHERYQKLAPVTGEELDTGIPILLSVSGGSVVRKNVTYYTVKCPECLVPAEYNEDSEPLCPKCGIICSGDGTLTEEQIVRDAKAAGRLDGQAE